MIGKGSAISFGVGVVLAVITITVVVLGIGFYNTAIRMETGVTAQYEQNKNNYDNYFKQLKEAAQVPDMYIADLQKVWDGVMRGRYGENGSRAMFQWIQEHNPTVSPDLYAKLQTIVVAGRNRFEADQKMLIDKKRELTVYYQTFPNVLYVSVLGFPKINLDDYAIVTSEETEGTFKTKKSEPLRLREK